MTHESEFSITKFKNLRQINMAFAIMVGMVTGCSAAAAQNGNTQPGSSLPSATPSPTNKATHTPFPSPSAAATSTSTPTLTSTPSPTPWLTATPLPTATPWPTPAAWAPKPLALPSLAPLPVVPTVVQLANGLTPVGYAPPDGVDVFGNTILRWSYSDELAEDEWFDIKIKPLGSENSAFVDWSKATEYELRPWHGWTPGLYTWQIGIVKGYKEGETKHFVADTGRDSQKAIMKWQALGYDGGGSGTNSGGGGSNTSGGS